MTQDEFDRKWAHVPETHTDDCGVMVGTCECTCGHQARRAERAGDEMSIGREERAAAEKVRWATARRRAQTRGLVVNAVIITVVVLLWTGLPLTSALLLGLWVAAKTFNWWSCAYGLLPSNWLDPGDAERGLRGWAKAMIVGVH